ncbi:hypothetical protein RTBOTA2_001233 [Rhodotorula toruloides]|uniref:Uncharacterized protein n=1 Tax=Rhodotorula toruloides TaxID=5286 RepID=A0A0K3CHI0_RHOTO|nr:hypothetical protein RTBOTA2_001233 [Rhodotorula toruloides]PRQ73051.1 hypothetical protein AAT19DRAFT_15804 [Rhodotorula toruloides]
MPSSSTPQHYAPADAKDWLLAPGSRFFSRQTNPETGRTALCLGELEEGSEAVRLRRSVYQRIIASYKPLHPLDGAEYRDLQEKFGDAVPSLDWKAFYAVVDNWPWFFPLEACSAFASKTSLTPLDAFIDLVLFATSCPSSKTQHQPQEDARHDLRTFLTQEFPVALSLWQRSLDRYSAQRRTKAASKIEPWTSTNLRQLREEVIAQAAGTRQYVVAGTRINSYEATLVEWLVHEHKAVFKPVERPQRNKLVKRVTRTASDPRSSISTSRTSLSSTPRDPLSSVTSLEQPEAPGGSSGKRDRLRNAVRVFKR